jgi:hypothetical protein
MPKLRKLFLKMKSAVSGSLVAIADKRKKESDFLVKKQ